MGVAHTVRHSLQNFGLILDEKLPLSLGHFFHITGVQTCNGMSKIRGRNIKGLDAAGLSVI